MQPKNNLKHNKVEATDILLEQEAQAIKVHADVEAILKKYGITKEEYEQRFFWHEGKIAILK